MVFKEPLLISKGQRDLYRNALNASAHSSFLRYAAPPAGGPKWLGSSGMRCRAALEYGPGHEQQVRRSLFEVEGKRIQELEPFQDLFVKEEAI